MAGKNGFLGYFGKLIKDNRFVIPLLCMLAVAIVGISSADISSYDLTSGKTGEFLRRVTYPNLAVPAYIGLYAAMFSAIYSFVRFKQRRNLDLLLALPISRKSVGNSHYLFGLLTTLAPLLTAYACNVIVIALKADIQTIHFGWYALHFIGTVVYSVLFYTMYVFVFNEANTVLDGCVFVFLWHNAFYWVMYSRAKDSINARLLSPERFLERITHIIEKPAGGDEADLFYRLFEDPEVVAAIFGWLFLGILAGVLFVTRFGKRQYERAGEVSNSIFGYNSLIPIYFISGSLFGYYSTPYDELGEPIDILFFIVGAFALYWLFRRSIKFKITDYFTLGFLALLHVTSMLIHWIPFNV